MQSLRLSLCISITLFAFGCKHEAVNDNDGGEVDGGSDGGDDGGAADMKCASGTLCGTPAVCCQSGEECVEAACVAACSSGIRCGVDSLTCCDAGQVCLAAACATPGATCTDSFDCDEGEFCEPTLQQCLPQPTGAAAMCIVKPTFGAFAATVDWSWLGHTDAVGADTKTYSNVCMTPMVADIDADGTPDVVFGAYPNIKSVVTDFKLAGTADDVWGATEDNNIRLVALDGKTGAEKFVLPITTVRIAKYTSVALAQLDADAELEVVGVADPVAAGQTDGVFILDNVKTSPTVKCFNGTGSIPQTRIGHSNPAFANMNDPSVDPLPEIIVAGIILDRDCNTIFDANAGVGHNIPNPTTLPKLLGCNGNGDTCSPVVADVDGDMNQDGNGHPLPEIIGGNLAYRYVAANPAGQKWSIYWDKRTDAAPTDKDGLVAIAEIFASNPGPEIVVVSNGHVFVRSARTGDLVWPAVATDAPTIGGQGGAPTIADFDGDGHLEFAAAGNAAYRVYDPDCTAAPDPAFCAGDRTGKPVGVLWENATQDLSSSLTGSSVFDFQGDGAAEVIYNDECFLRVYDGKTGAELLKRPNSSRTSGEYPIVVDVDGDNNSEFVVPANNDQIGRDRCPEYCPARADGDPVAPICGTSGLFVFGDPDDKWMRTRRVWNQYAYHVTNSSPGGVVPSTEPNNWETPGLNNYRQNVQGEGVFNAPDLAITGVSADLDGCPDSITIQARVANQGSLGVMAGIPIAFYLGSSATGTPIAVVPTTHTLLPGGSETVSFVYTPAAMDSGPFTFHVVADSDAMMSSTQPECKEDNNSGDISDVKCVGIL